VYLRLLSLAFLRPLIAPGWIHEVKLDVQGHGGKLFSA